MSNFLNTFEYLNIFIQTKVSISKSTYDKMRQKRKEEKELFDVKDCGKKEQNPWEQMKHTVTEKMTSESKWDLPFGLFLSTDILKLE
jgi:hypothetical protein